jgi:protein transport protein SEC24
LQEPNKIDGSLKRLPLTMHCLDTGGLYLLDDGFTFLVWLGRMLPPELVNNILGVSLANFPDLSKVNLSYIFVRLNKVILHPSI